MNSVFVKEFKKASKDINSKRISNKKIKKITSAYNRILYYSDVIRTEGILKMEELASIYKDDGLDGFFKFLTLCVVDGIDPDKVFEVGILRLTTDGYSGTDALIGLMYLKGILMMQEGISYHEITLYMKSLLPEPVRKEIKEIEQYNKLSPEEECIERINELIVGDSNINSNTEPMLKQLSSVIIHLTDDDFKRVFNYLRYLRMEFHDLVMVMKVLPGTARKKIFDNIDIRSSEELIFAMDCMGPIRLSDAEDAAKEILKSIEWLMETDEIRKVEFESIKTILAEVVE